MAALPTWASVTVRADSPFPRSLKLIASAALEGTDYNARVAEEAAEGIARKLKLIDLPRAMESFGGTTQETRARSLAREMRSLGAPLVRQELLRERFIEAIVNLAGVRAMVGVRNDATCEMGGAAGFALCAEVAVRTGISRTEADFQWAALREMRDTIAHLDEMLRAAPWINRTARERADHVIDLHRTQSRRMSSTVFVAGQAGAPGGGGDHNTSLADARGRGAVPKHFQADVAPAMAKEQYRNLKGAVLARISLGVMRESGARDSGGRESGAAHVNNVATSTAAASHTRERRTRERRARERGYARYL